MIVARFLALLEMFRDRAVAFEQAAPLADLSVRWTAGEDWSADRLSEEYDDGGEPSAGGEPGTVDEVEETQHAG
jgi:segregation and condensation protein A